MVSSHSTSSPLAHLIVPICSNHILPISTPPSPSPSSSPSYPISPFTINTNFNESTQGLLFHHASSSSIPIRPPRSPRRPPPKRLDANIGFSFTTPSTPESSWKRQKRRSSNFSVASLEYVRTALRNFRSTIPLQRFPDKSPIRSPSRKLHRKTSSWIIVEVPTIVGQETMESEERRKSEEMVDELLSNLRGKAHERYGPVKDIKRAGVGGHWRSYSTPPPAFVSEKPEDGIEGKEGKRRAMSQDCDQPNGPLAIVEETTIQPFEPIREFNAPLPTLHIIHPSISTTPDDPSVYPPRRLSSHALHHTQGTVLDVDEDLSDLAAPLGEAVDATLQLENGHLEIHDEVPRNSESGSARTQTARRNRVGPGGIISSRSSLAKLKIAFAPSTDRSSQLHPQTARLSQRQPSPSPSKARYSITRSAPLPPTNLSPTPTKFAASSSRVPSPSPSGSRPPTPLTAPSFSGTGVKLGGISPGRATIWDKEEDMIEIPRFKKRELNLGIVRGGAGQRLAWWGLWAIWLIWGLISLFFDVNVLYMLVQCAQNPSIIPDSASARTWVFAVAAYGICWGISIVGVWIGWELGFEFWRRWRLPRPAIEPIYTSLPAALHLSLKSFPHFTFFLYIRQSPLRTPHAMDILPETAHLTLQTLPGLGPVLPRSALGIVLLVAFSGGDNGSTRDPAFWTPITGELTNYSQGVLSAFATFTGVRILLVVTSAITLWIFSRPRRPTRRNGYHTRNQSGFASFSTSSQPETRPSTPESQKARDPANTQSPSKGWMAESDFKWEWRERGRNRLQDAFELCMIRRPRTMGSTGRRPEGQREIQGSPSRSGGNSMPLRPMRAEEEGEKGEDQEILSPHSADPFMRLDKSTSTSTVKFLQPSSTPEPDCAESPTTPIANPLVQARPESDIEPKYSPSAMILPISSTTPIVQTRHSTSSSLVPSQTFGNINAARQSASSQDIFYTPMSGTPMTESLVELHGMPMGRVRDAPTPTPPSAYRRPSAILVSDSEVESLVPVDGPSGLDAEKREFLSKEENAEAEEYIAGSSRPENRNSWETMSAESITDDRAALLSRSSVHSGENGGQSSSSHSTPNSTSDSIRRASQSFRDRSASLIAQFRDRSGSLGTSEHQQSGQTTATPGSRRASYSTLKGEGGDTSEFGVKSGKQGGLGRFRSTSVGLSKDSVVDGSIEKDRDGKDSDGGIEDSGTFGLISRKSSNGGASQNV